MNFERIIGDVAAMNLNLYDLALYSDGRIQSHCFCVRWSHHSIAGRITCMSLSSATRPCI